MSGVGSDIVFEWTDGDGARGMLERGPREHTFATIKLAGELMIEDDRAGAAHGIFLEREQAQGLFAALGSLLAEDMIYAHELELPDED